MKQIAVIAFIISLTVAIVPLISMFCAWFFTMLFSCTLTEGPLSECPTIFGDLGNLLYQASVLNNLLFYTVPLGFAGALGSIILFAYLHHKHSQ